MHFKNNNNRRGELRLTFTAITMNCATGYLTSYLVKIGHALISLAVILFDLNLNIQPPFPVVVYC